MEIYILLHLAKNIFAGFKKSMRITANYYYGNINKNGIVPCNKGQQTPKQNYFSPSVSSPTSNMPAFEGSLTKNIIEYLNFLKVKKYAKIVEKELANEPNGDKILFRNLSMEAMEGIQYGIEVFKGLSMKDIQYMSENLHVIAVKRGCKNMCGYCYADAKPSNREMSWEDFKLITDGYKKLRKRLGNLPLFGENMTSRNDTLLYRSTELFYDSDCIDIAIKDKKGNIYDFTKLSSELYNSLGRRTVFDTSGWDPNNKKLQERAEKYAEYFSKPENMDQLNAFNLSFNCFNASYIAAVKALKNGDKEKYLRLKNKFTDRIANALYTFTPLVKDKKFNVMTRSFGDNAKNAQYFDFSTMFELGTDVLNKLAKMYSNDLKGEQKYVKSNAEIENLINLYFSKIYKFDANLNSSGRMGKFMQDFKITAPMQDHTETTVIMAQDLKTNGRYHRYLGMKLIDTDGKVYHMDYARFFPTEIQLNLKNKSETPKLANLREDFPISKEDINRKEVLRDISDFI